MTYTLQKAQLTVPLLNRHMVVYTEASETTRQRTAEYLWDTQPSRRKLSD